MTIKMKAILSLVIPLVWISSLGYGQGNRLPDWSGAWTMVGGPVFDRATQTGQGGALPAVEVKLVA